jgi:hypothetical protein
MRVFLAACRNGDISVVIKGSGSAHDRRRDDMQYAILIYENDTDFSARGDAERQGPYWAGWRAYSQALADSGVMRGGAPLQGAHAATTVRMNGRGRQVQDGPYADTKEQLGGFYLIEVADLNAALDWATRCPATGSGVVEVRPVLQRNTA